MPFKHFRDRVMVVQKRNVRDQKGTAHLRARVAQMPLEGCGGKRINNNCYVVHVEGRYTAI